MVTIRPTSRIYSKTRAILKQYSRFAGHLDYVGIDLLVRNDPWERHAVGYFVDFTNPDHVEISRALMPIRWTWLSWGKQICEDWHVLRCQKDDPLAVQWKAMQTSFRESRSDVVPDRRIRDGDVYYAIVEHVSYPSLWIVDREYILELCWNFQVVVDQRMLADGAQVKSG